MTSRFIGFALFLAFTTSLSGLSVAQQASIKADCAYICTEARVTSDGYWALITVNSTGEVLDFNQTEVPSDKPLDQWLIDVAPIDGFAKTGDTPNPPPNGTGPVSEGSSHYGWNGDDYGVYFITITYYFVDYELVDIETDVRFKQEPVPPPGDDQTN